MKITNDDVKILLDGGVRQDDIPQIKSALRKLKLTLFIMNYNGYFVNKEGTRITPEYAIELLGRKTFLFALYRAAFHWDCGRETEDRKCYISFDCSKLFR